MLAPCENCSGMERIKLPPTKRMKFAKERALYALVRFAREHSVLISGACEDREDGQDDLNLLMQCRPQGEDHFSL